MYKLDETLNLDNLNTVSNYLSYFEDWELNYDCTNIYLDHLSWLDKLIEKKKVVCEEELNIFFEKKKVVCEEELNIFFEKENTNKCLQDINKVNAFFNKRKNL